MFIWLASYPKSGNTLTRSLLSSYFFSEDGSFNFDLLKNIKQFPDKDLFKNFGINVENEIDMIKNYIYVQKKINKKNSIQFFKTHSHLFNIKNNPFTNLDYSLGVIYIVRDPRNVLISAAHHNQKSHEKILDEFINGYVIGTKDKNQTPVYCGNWKSNYESWKSFKPINRYLLVKYEDLINDKEKIFYQILKFVHNLKNVEFILDKKKFQNTLDSTDFNKMQRLEESKGFEESVKDKKTGKKIKFFRLGKKTDWKNILDPELQEKINKVFKKEMIELGYL
tara:strand:+ start:35 stop:874 length:840 start_codon:yes stop_codon:yes gene_type:complete